MGSCCADGVLRAAELGPCTLPMYYISQEHMARALGKAAGWVAAASTALRPCIAARGRQAAVVVLRTLLAQGAHAAAAGRA